jgi:hypothetical protein
MTCIESDRRARDLSRLERRAKIRWILDGSDAKHAVGLGHPRVVDVGARALLSFAHDSSPQHELLQLFDSSSLQGSLAPFPISMIYEGNSSEGRNSSLSVE